MSLTVVDHPLAQHLLTQLRDVSTPPPVFRTLAKRLTIALVLEAVRGLPTVDVEVQTPLEPAPGRLISPDLVAVPSALLSAAPTRLTQVQLRQQLEGLYTLLVAPAVAGLGQAHLHRDQHLLTRAQAEWTVDPEPVE